MQKVMFAIFFAFFVIFALPTERRRQFTNHYAHAKLAKTIEEISLFLTAQDMVKFSKKGQNIWKKVESV